MVSYLKWKYNNYGTFILYFNMISKSTCPVQRPVEKKAAWPIFVLLSRPYNTPRLK